MKSDSIKITIQIDASIEKVWDNYTKPEHIMEWNYATDEWHCPSASCDLRPKGEFSFRMASKDGKHEFDLKGTYIDILDQEYISYALEDGRKVYVNFEDTANGISIEQTFEPESSNSHEVQRHGWQAILENFKKYVEIN